MNKKLYFICEHHDNILCRYFSAGDITPLSPLVPPSPIPLFNPREVQLGKKDDLSGEEKNSSSKENVNPYREAANGMD